MASCEMELRSNFRRGFHWPNVNEKSRLLAVRKNNHCKTRLCACRKVGLETTLIIDSAHVANWDHPNPKGCYQLQKCVHLDGLHPGNVGWPVAEPWTRQYNFNGGIASSFTGEYGMDGNNTGSAPALLIMPASGLINMRVTVG